MKGLLITFEGIDSSGKTTQARLLVEGLKGLGYEVLFTHEPGGTEIAEKIRDLVLSKENSGMLWLTELFLYMASRAQHTEELIRRSMEQGKVVVCDRYADSTLAYQGYGRGLDRKLICQLNEIATRGLRPRLTFLIDIPPQVAVDRKSSKDRLESEDLSFHSRVRQGYLDIATRESDRFFIIDGSKPIQQISKEIMGIVKDSLKKEGEESV